MNYIIKYKILGRFHKITKNRHLVPSTILIYVLYIYLYSLYIVYRYMFICVNQRTTSLIVLYEPTTLVLSEIVNKVCTIGIQKSVGVPRQNIYFLFLTRIILTIKNYIWKVSLYWIAYVPCIQRWLYKKCDASQILLQGLILQLQIAPLENAAAQVSGGA